MDRRARPAVRRRARASRPSSAHATSRRPRPGRTPGTPTPRGSRRAAASTSSYGDPAVRRGVRRTRGQPAAARPLTTVPPPASARAPRLTRPEPAPRASMRPHDREHLRRRVACASAVAQPTIGLARLRRQRGSRPRPAARRGATITSCRPAGPARPARRPRRPTVFRCSLDELLDVPPVPRLRPAALARAGPGCSSDSSTISTSRPAPTRIDAARARASARAPRALPSPRPSCPAGAARPRSAAPDSAPRSSHALGQRQGAATAPSAGELAKMRDARASPSRSNSLSRPGADAARGRP